MQRLCKRMVKISSDFRQYYLLNSKYQDTATILNFRGKVVMDRHLSHHLHQMPKTLATPIPPREIRTRYGDYVIREAKPTDKNGVLSIQEDLYAGLDFLPDMYDKLVSPPNGKAFVVQDDSRIVWFSSMMLLDDNESCYMKGLRLPQDLAGKGLLTIFTNVVVDWTISNGARVYVGTNTDHVSPNAKGLMNMNLLIYLMQLENIHLPWRDLDTSHHVLLIPFEQVSTYFRSDDVSHYLFPGQRIMVDIVPYKLMASNMTLMKEISGHHTHAFSDVRIESGTIKGLLSFGTLFKGHAVSYVYGIEVYGTDASSVKSHIVRHLTELQKAAYGSVCLMVFVQDDFPQKAADETCLGYGMKRVNCPGTEYPQWNV